MDTIYIYQIIAVNMKHVISIFCHFSNEKDTGMDPCRTRDGHSPSLYIYYKYKWTITTLYSFSTKKSQLVTSTTYPWCRSCPIIPHTGIIEGEAQITDLELERVDREAEFGALIVRIFRTQCHNTGTSKKLVPVCLYHNKSISSQGVPLSISAGVFNGHFCKKILNIPIKTKEY